jgi:hypothetical protein
VLPAVLLVKLEAVAVRYLQYDTVGKDVELLRETIALSLDQGNTVSISKYGSEEGQPA